MHFFLKNYLLYYVFKCDLVNTIRGILLRKLPIILILMLNINNIDINNEKYTCKYLYFNHINNDFDINYVFIINIY